MEMIASLKALQDLRQRVADSPILAIDTEFMRENTFWPRLCLIQVATAAEAAVIDPLAPDMTLEPLFGLLRDPGVLKVFHAARQDIEIFYNLLGEVPAPVFDTQVAAMVLGFGEQVSYETLAAKLVAAEIDKSSRFTDWARRPLSERQLRYAVADVQHLPAIYDRLRERLSETGRKDWLSEEMATLTDPRTYAQEPDEAWRRIRVRSTNPRFLGVLKELAAWREREAQSRNLPRSWVLKDEALSEIAGDPPTTAAELTRVRGLSAAFAEGRHGASLLAAVARGIALDPSAVPRPPRPAPSHNGPLVDLLKVLLKAKCESHGVAQKLVASSADLDRIAAGDTEVAALFGWRREIFGADALALKEGRLALSASRRRVKLVPLDS